MIKIRIFLLLHKFRYFVSNCMSLYIIKSNARIVFCLEYIFKLFTSYVKRYMLFFIWSSDYFLNFILIFNHFLCLLINCRNFWRFKSILLANEVIVFAHWFLNKILEYLILIRTGFICFCYFWVLKVKSFIYSSKWKISIIAIELLLIYCICFFMIFSWSNRIHIESIVTKSVLLGLKKLKFQFFLFLNFLKKTIFLCAILARSRNLIFQILIFWHTFSFLCIFI